MVWLPTASGERDIKLVISRGHLQGWLVVGADQGWILVALEAAESFSPILNLTHPLWYYRSILAIELL